MSPRGLPSRRGHGLTADEVERYGGRDEVASRERDASDPAAGVEKSGMSAYTGEVARMGYLLSEAARTL